jgi:hypothetical protein
LPGEASVIRNTAIETRIMVRNSSMTRLTINFAIVIACDVFLKPGGPDLSGPPENMTRSKFAARLR